MKTYPGLLITVEGIDGSGKTTNIQHIVDKLQSYGYDVVRTREPGGSELAEKIRDLVLNNKTDSLTELFLFVAARTDHYNRTILPALNDGKIVVCDRYMDSTFAYQGHGRGLQHEVEIIEKWFHKEFLPDITLYFRITLEESTNRLINRNADINHFDQEKQDFKARMLEGFEERIAKDPNRFIVINAMGSEGEVKKQVEDAVISNCLIRTLT